MPLGGITEGKRPLRLGQHFRVRENTETPLPIVALEGQEHAIQDSSGDAEAARRFMRTECSWPERDIDALASVRPAGRP